MKLRLSSWLFAVQALAMVILAAVFEKANKAHDADRLMECAVLSLLAAILLRMKP